MKQPNLSIKDTLELFQGFSQKRNQEMGGKYLGSPAHLRSTRKMYNRLLEKHGKSNSMQDQMELESIRDARKSINKQLTPNFIKRNAKQFIRWGGRQLRKGVVAMVNQGKQAMANRAARRNQEQAQLFELPGIRKQNAAESQEVKKSRVNGPVLVKDRKMNAAPTEKLKRNVASGTKATVNAKQTTKKVVPAEKLNRNLARSTNRTVTPAKKEVGMRIY